MPGGMKIFLEGTVSKPPIAVQSRASGKLLAPPKGEQADLCARKRVLCAIPF